MMTEMMTQKLQKKDEFFCELCDYKTVRKSSWNKHVVTIKHQKREMMTESCKKLQKLQKLEKKFICDCGKGYAYRQGLYVHRKKCDVYNKQLCATSVSASATAATTASHPESSIEHHVICELTTIVKDLIKSGIYNTTNTNSFNTINKNDIKIFLSNECANALSIQDFVQKLAITMDDLNSTRENTAYGIAKIVENNLKPLTITERPMHHIEQDEWYIKDKKKGWEADDGTRIVSETQKGIQKKWSTVFEQEHPEWVNSEDDTNNFIQIAKTTTQELNDVDVHLIKQNLSKQCLIKRNYKTNMANMANIADNFVERTPKIQT